MPTQEIFCRKEKENQERVWSVIELIAAGEKVSPAVVRTEMQTTIDAAWDNKTDQSAAAWRKYFPSGEKPSVEKFVLRLAEIGSGEVI